MSRLFASAIALVIAGQAAVAGTLDRVRDGGVFRIGYRADAKPYSYRNDQGQAAGYVVDLCLEIAKAFGPKVRTEFVLVPPDQRFEAVRDGRADILCDPTSITMARRETVDFSLPTFLDGASVLSRSSKPVRVFEDFAGKRIGVLAGTTTEETLRGSLGELALKATIVPVPDHRAGFSLLSDDKIDAYFADRGIVMGILQEGGWPGFEVSKSYFSYETYALALPRDDGAFRLLVDRTLAQLYRSGKINAILERTFGKGEPPDMLKAMFLINSLPEK
ncbi:amino acid ABC transporter substrate-binding protein [Rhodoplanes sp. Z2-YC6860]|uniref:amino acid ABC transporter substrate-binding protein n=1 Tax=Rhodoplanes sp. Z2-YC6860 TaxID=674703 RepID=UPI00078C2E03|nr:amino acid ABC transporter substrate-binding protein [Rhodoplanes sp. Z2-YC6860]AMN42874.1 extracellular solute-binding protein [Rhodoplanes sp. Z2-YC6860]